MYICFYKDGKKEYYEVDKNIKKIDKPRKKGFLEKRVLVISSKDAHYLKETFPKTTYENLKNIIQNHIEDVYPNEKMDFNFNIAKTYENTVKVNIFVFPFAILEDVKKDFEFTHVIAEPLCFKTKENDILIYKEDDIYNILAVSEEGLYSYLQIKDFSRDYFEFFLKGLSDFEMKNIISYEDLSLDMDIVRKQPKAYPVFLDYIKSIDLKPYKRYSAFKINEDLVFRAIIYFLIGYGAALYVNHRYYQENIKKIHYLDKKLKPFIKASLVTKETNKNHYNKSFIKAYENTVIKIDPIFILDNITSHFHKGDYLTQIDIKPLHPTVPQANFTIVTKKPFEFLESLSKDSCIKDFNLESPLSENMQKVYNLNMKVEYLCVP
ncbi:hypothetical protein [Hydrogenobaculum sp.]